MLFTYDLVVEFDIDIRILVDEIVDGLLSFVDEVGLWQVTYIYNVVAYSRYQFYSSIRQDIDLFYLVSPEFIRHQRFA